MKKSITWSRFLKIETRVGGCGRKSTEPKETWPSSTVELLDYADEKAVEFMNPTLKIPTIGAN
jgi:hypothetical protein